MVSPTWFASELPLRLCGSRTVASTADQKREVAGRSTAGQAETSGKGCTKKPKKIRKKFGGKLLLAD
jgi:hypothetical protein